MSQTTVGSLRVTLGMDSAAFEKGMKQTGKSLDRAAARFKQFSAAAAAAMSVAAAAVSAAVVKISGDFDKLGKTAEKLGVTTKELQGLRYAAELSGVPIQTLETSLQRFARRLGEAAVGTGVLKDVVKNYGIELKDSSGRMRSTVDILGDYADIVQKAGSQQERLRLLIKAFDTEGGKMFELLKNGSKGVAALRAEFEKLGFVADQKTIVAATAFNDNISRMQTILTGVGQRLVAAVLPAFLLLSDRIVKATTSGTAMQTVMQTLTSVFNGVANAIVFVFNNLDKLWQLFKVFIAAKIVSFFVAVIGTFYTLARAIRTTGLVMLAFNAIARIKIKTILLIAGAIAVAVGKYDEFEAKVKSFGRRILAALPKGLQDLGGKLASALEVDDTAAAKNLATYMKAANEAKRLNDALSKGSRLPTGGKAGKGKKTSGKSSVDKIKASYDRIIETGEMFIRKQNAATAAIGLTEKAAEALRIETDLLNKAARANITLTDGQKEQISDLANRMAAASEKTRVVQRAFDFAKDATKGFVSELRAGLMAGEGFWKSFGKAALNVLNKIINKIEDQLVNALFSLKSGGSGAAGGIGNIFGSVVKGIGSLFGFAQGGSFNVGGTGGIDSQLVAFKASPNENVTVTKPGQAMAGVQRQEIIVRGVFVDDNGVVAARVQNDIRQASPAIVAASQKQMSKSLPGMIGDVQRRRG